MLSKIPLSAIACILAHLSAVHAEEVKVVHEDLASQEVIDTGFKFANNLTAIVDGHTEGWYETKICFEEYCVWSNREVANGRGVVAITSQADKKVFRAVAKHLDSTPDWLASDASKKKPGLEVKDGQGLVATETIRRNTRLMALTPVLLVESYFMDDAPEKTREDILEAAVSLLPAATKKQFDRQRKKGVRTLNIKAILQANPYEVAMEQTGDKHYANYPEIWDFEQNCRPNSLVHGGWSGDMFIQASVARRVLPGEQLSISHLTILNPRTERQSESEQLLGHKCQCPHCTNLELITKSEERIKEMRELNGELEDWRSKGITTNTIKRFLDLYEKEGMHSRMASAYFQAALNYSYLGHKKEALKFANKALQASILEWGQDSNDAIAIKIFMDDPEGHYSWRKRVPAS